MCNKFLHTLAAIIIIATTATLTSCDSTIYEDLEPCEVSHGLRFIWDHNMLFADAFAGNVSSVAVYGFDSHSDKLAWIRTEKGDRVSMNGNTLTLTDVPAGDYNVVAWCGLTNDGKRPESFVPAEMQIGKSTRQELYCRMEREIREDGSHHSSSDLYDLYHGTAYGVKIYDGNTTTENRNHIYDVKLKKDTNRVRIILQQLSGNDLDVENFTFTIKESNGLLGHDNRLMEDEEVTYHPHSTLSGIAGVDTDPKDVDLGSRANTNVRVAIADLTISRLMADRKSTLTILNDEGERVVRVPLTDYALLVKDNYRRPMTDQEYLDRQDSYTLTFFLDKNGEWAAASIIINQWAVVPNDVDFGN